MKRKTFWDSGKGEEKLTEFRVYGMEASGIGSGLAQCVWDSLTCIRPFDCLYNVTLSSHM
jgi:hypothetical protein